MKNNKFHINKNWPQILVIHTKFHLFQSHNMNPMLTIRFFQKKLLCSRCLQNVGNLISELPEGQIF